MWGFRGMNSFSFSIFIDEKMREFPRFIWSVQTLTNRDDFSSHHMIHLKEYILYTQIKSMERCDNNNMNVMDLSVANSVYMLTEKSLSSNKISLKLLNVYSIYN